MSLHRNVVGSVLAGVGGVVWVATCVVSTLVVTGVAVVVLVVLWEQPTSPPTLTSKTSVRTRFMTYPPLERTRLSNRAGPAARGDPSVRAGPPVSRSSSVARARTHPFL